MRYIAIAVVAVLIAGGGAGYFAYQKGLETGTVQGYEQGYTEAETKYKPVDPPAEVTKFVDEFCIEIAKQDIPCTGMKYYDKMELAQVYTGYLYKLESPKNEDWLVFIFDQNGKFVDLFSLFE